MLENFLSSGARIHGTNTKCLQLCTVKATKRCYARSFKWEIKMECALVPLLITGREASDGHSNTSHYVRGDIQLIFRIAL
jgi:hypothetical protein